MKLKFLVLFTQLMILLIPLTGCTRQYNNVSWAEQRPLGSDFAIYHASEEMPEIPSETSEFEEPAGTITLHHSLTLALSNNPEFAVSAWEVRAAEAGAHQAALLPNPELEVEVEEFGGKGETEGFDSAVTSIHLNQKFEIGGKRGRRFEMAGLEAEIAGWEFENKRLDVHTETVKRFVELLAAQEQLSLAESALTLAGNVHRAVSERVSSGKDSPVDQIKSKTELASAGLAVDMTRRSLEKKRQSLAAMWGSQKPAFDKADGSLMKVSEKLPSLDQMLLNLSWNPEIAQWASKLKLAEASLNYEKSGRYPDIDLGAGIAHSNAEGEQTYVAGIGFEIPIFNRNQGTIQEARAQIEKVKYEKNAATVALHSAMAEVYQDLISTQHAVITINHEILPAAQETFSAVEEGYRMGRFSYLEVLDAQRTLYETKNTLTEAQVEYLMAVAETERLTGKSMDELMENVENK